MTDMISSTTAPWLSPETQALINGLLISYQRAFAQPLLVCDQSGPFNRTAAQELFASPIAVLAHDHSADPLLTYVNSTALRIWGHSWQTMVGMPSRLTAEESEQRERANALQQAHHVQRDLAPYFNFHTYDRLNVRLNLIVPVSLLLLLFYK